MLTAASPEVRVVRGVGGGPACTSLSAAVGWLLGYPILYYLPTAEQTNCLGNIPLTIYEFAARLSLEEDGGADGVRSASSSIRASGNATNVLTSFSVPEAFTSAGVEGKIGEEVAGEVGVEGRGEGGWGVCRKKVEEWARLMAALGSEQEAFVELSTTSRVVAMGAVAL